MNYEGSDGGPLPTAIKTANLRMPKVVQWRPLPDIAAHELAQAVTVLFGMALGAAFPEDEIAKLPPEVQRHFSVSEHPIFK